MFVAFVSALCLFGFGVTLFVAGFVEAVQGHLMEALIRLGASAGTGYEFDRLSEKSALLFKDARR